MKLRMVRRTISMSSLILSSPKRGNKVEAALPLRTATCALELTEYDLPSINLGARTGVLGARLRHPT